MTLWTPRVTVLFQVYAFMYVGVSRISGRCCGLMVGLSHGAHICGSLGLWLLVDFESLWLVAHH